jgi:GNAT superfamily N-acetyltransferase
VSAEALIRAAGVGDAEGLARLWVEMGEHLVSLEPATFQVPSAVGLVEFFAGLLERPRDANRAWLVAESDGEVVGQVRAHLEQPVESAAFQVQRHLAETRLVVDVLAVTARCRRRGVGRALMSGIQDWGAARGATHVALDTFALSPLSVPFYERLGFTRAAILFEKRL